ncbi:MAG TPA: glycogen/starch synthase, partial [Phycisphaeraceae bacterium]
MRVLMLGWEFPPYISGGLGTACYGLTKALSRRQMQVTFVLPRAVNTAHDSHVKLLPAGTAGQSGWSWSSEISSPAEEAQLAISDPALANVTFLAVPSRIRNPYAYSGQAASVASQGSTATGPSLRAFEPISVLRPMDGGNGMGGEYQGDLMAEAQRYARLCVDLARHEDFDVIHAHD